MKTLRVMIVCAVVLCVGALPCEAIGWGKVGKREYSRDYSEGANHGVKVKMVVEGDKSKCGGKVHGWRRRGVVGFGLGCNFFRALHGIAILFGVGYDGQEMV